MIQNSLDSYTCLSRLYCAFAAALPAKIETYAMTTGEVIFQRVCNVLYL